MVRRSRHPDDDGGKGGVMECPPRARRYRLNRPQPGTVRLWTIQGPAVWKALRRDGHLYVDPELQELDPYHREPYNWLCSQMALRIPGYQGHDPWWAYDYPVDLRQFRYLAGHPGERCVRLELAVPQEQVLLSSYGAWHWVLSLDYLPQSTDPAEYQREADAWDLEQDALRRERTDWTTTEPYRTRIRKSWERIFDVEDLRATDTIQATFERLNLAEVVAVTEFTAASRKP